MTADRAPEAWVPCWRSECRLACYYPNGCDKRPEPTADRAPLSQPNQPKETTMRDLITYLLRAKGWTHDDAADPADMFWRKPNVVQPMGVHILAAAAAQMNTDLAESSDGGGYYTPVVKLQTSYAPGRPFYEHGGRGGMPGYDQGLAEEYAASHA